MADAASAAQTGIETDLAGLAGLAGSELGATAWQQMTQERVNAFADATDDHQFIHVDPVRAAATPFGGAIAHGFLTLSLLAPACRQLLTVSDAAMTVNYGLDRVRFPAPLPVGASFRAVARVSEVRPLEGAVQVHLSLTVEVRDAAKPAAVAEQLLRFYA
jgi:acyl dehydratase